MLDLKAIHTHTLAILCMHINSNHRSCYRIASGNVIAFAVDRRDLCS